MRCKTCGEDKDLDAFEAHRLSCRACRLRLRREMRALHRMSTRKAQPVTATGIRREREEARMARELLAEIHSRVRTVWSEGQEYMESELWRRVVDFLRRPGV